MERRQTLAMREALHNHLGYEPRQLAHRHRISRADAERIIADIGPDRRKLDRAAIALKQSKAKPPSDGD